MLPEPRTDPLRVLIASTDPELCRRLSGELRQAGLQTLEADSRAAFLGEASTGDCNVALVDARSAAGLEWCRALPRTPRLPALALVALVESSGLPGAREAGATDCCPGDADAGTLVDRLHSARRQHALELQLEALQQPAAGAQASAPGARSAPPMPDQLQFLARLAHQMAKAQPPNDQIAVLSLHLDLERALYRAPQSREFVLTGSAQRIKHCIRDRDTLGTLASRIDEVSMAQLGEAQFALLLPGLVRPHDAYKVARRLVETLAAPLSFEGEELDLECSVGISVAPHDGVTAEALLQSAHGAERLARAGDHGVQFFTAAMNASAFERLTLENSLRKALEQRELCVYYQPKVDIQSGLITGFEALARWKHPELGMVSPGQFIPVAEETGLIVPLSEFVLEEACSTTRAWMDAGLPRVRMAVNLSGVHFRAPNLIEVVAGTLERTRLPADALELELTESILLQKAEATVTRLNQLKKMGVRLSIDDFGTGYSSLSYLKRFPVDALKIDQSFIREVTSDPEDAAITTSIILMGKSLKLKIVAEGVETESQLQFLRVLECDEAQGYLLGRPMPADDARKLLERQLAAKR